MATYNVYTGTEYAGTQTRVTCNVQDDGAHYQYDVIFEKKDGGGEVNNCIDFQRGSVAVEGLNGIQDEGVLAVLIDRLRHFQAGQFACADNEEALNCLERAHDCMERRKRDRIKRGVEGLNEA